MPLAQGEDVEYRFNDVRVDTRGHSVTRAGVELQLEPKAYAVLLQLLGRPGAVFERDELLDAVWGHRHVTPAVLNRVIAMLRRELGDHADHPTIIRTVHGVGYSLIATVATAAATESDAVEVPAVADVPVSEAAAAENRDAPSTQEPAPAQPVSVASRGVAPSLPAAAPERASSRWWIGTGLVLAAVAVFVSWSWWSSTRQRMPAPAATNAPVGDAASQPMTLAVLPFDIEGNDAELRELASGLTDSFSESLARVADLRVTSAESTAIAVSADAQPRAVVRALSVQHALGGKLRSVDAAILELELTLHDAARAGPIWTHVVRNARAQPFRLLGPALDAIADGPLGQSRAKSIDPAFDAALDAQDLYWLGRQHLGRGDVASWRRALALFEDAARIDPTYALPLTGVSRVHRALAISGEQPLEESARLSLAAVERALAIDPNLAEAYVEKALASTMQWRAIEGRDAARRAMELAPNHPDVLWINGNIENYLGRPRAAVALHQRAQAGDPLSSHSVTRLGQDYMALGDEEKAREHFQKARLLSSQPQIDPMQLRMGLAFGRISVLTLPDTDAHVVPSTYAELHRAQAWSMLGFHGEAKRILNGIRAPISAGPLHMAVYLDAFWRKAQWREALQWGQNVGAGLTQEPWRTIWIAQARVLSGDRAAGLRDYDRMLADPANRALLTHSWFPTRIGIGQVANWVVLRREAGATYEAELAALKSDMADFAEGGVDSPAFDYHRAVAAAIAGDAVDADARLGRAIARGWLDDVAFDTDFIWREFRAAPWLEARRAELRARLATERKLALVNQPAAKS